MLKHDLFVGDKIENSSLLCTHLISTHLINTHQALFKCLIGHPPVLSRNLQNSKSTFQQSPSVQFMYLTIISHCLVSSLQTWQPIAEKVSPKKPFRRSQGFKSAIKSKFWSRGSQQTENIKLIYIYIYISFEQNRKPD